jgi:exodeoxyribonuclease V gamma subunit
MLSVIQSNRPEILADRLADLLRDEPLQPLVQETIVIQSDGIGRWLKLALAERLGIAASMRFPFPASFVWELVARVVPDVPRESPLAPEVLKWRVAAALARVGADTRFTAIERYLADGDPLKAYQLAQRLATVLDRYLVYRPDWIAAWRAGKDVRLGAHEAWQAALWREIAAELPAAAQTDPRERFLTAIHERAEAREALPPRIHLFALEALPPPYLEFFRQIARHRDVRLWIVNPCREYWPLIEDPRRVARARTEIGPEAGHRETGNRLLASLGRHGRALIDSVVEDPGGVEGEYVDPAEVRRTLLAALQSDVLALRERGDAGAPLLEFEPTDRSLTVHVCHSPMREIEVLHDQLLDRFARDPTLRPADVLVLVPDVAMYAPLIDAVFGTAPKPRHIPYAIADRTRAADSAALRAFRALLAIPEGRLEAEQVLALLEFSSVARRFGIRAEDLTAVRTWVRQAGIRWGRDETTRTRLGLPPARAHSWRAGLERLFLGYAMAGEGSQLFAGTLPIDGVEGGDANLAACLSRFAENVFALDDILRTGRTLRAWSDALAAMLERFIASDEDEASENIAIRTAVERMARDAAEAGFGEDVPLAVVRAHLDGVLGGVARSSAFLAGGVTFAALGPARPIPARLVWMIGLNDEVFPRVEHPPVFDLVAHHARLGDRTRREEDRYAFLQAILSAREALGVSYTGRSVRDNKAIPPSPVLTELLEVAQRAFFPEERAAAIRDIVVVHPLQPFSQRYGGSDARLFTYAAEYARRIPPPGAPRFAGHILADAGTSAAILTIEALAHFLANPTRHFLERRLGVRIDASDGPLEGAEPFSLTELAGWEADQRAFSLRRSGHSVDEVRSVLRAAGMLPDGAAGDAALAERLADIDPILAALDRVTFVDPIEAVIDIPGTTPPLRLAVALDGLTSEGRIAWRVGGLRAEDRLRAWLAHLALAALAPAGVPPRTRLLSRKKHQNRARDVLFGVPDRPLARLATLAELYVAGSSEVVPFFPETALAFATLLAKGEDAAWRAAEKMWTEERDGDAYFALAFRDSNPLDARFAAHAREIYGPMLAAEVDDG